MENETIVEIAAEMRKKYSEYFDAEDVRSVLRDFANRIEAAWKREKSQSWHHREMEELILQHEKEVAELKKLIPQPDPDWKAICEKCHDGEIEPECEYYGEPNGCNSPIYGEHPKASLGNNAAIRKALNVADETANELLNWCSNHYQELNCMGSRLKRALEGAAKEPWRNCDRFGGDYKMLHTAWFDWTGSPSGHNPDGTAKMAFGEWLLAKASITFPTNNITKGENK